MLVQLLYVMINPYWTGRTDMSLPGKRLEGQICPSLVKDWKDIYVPLLLRHGGFIMLSVRAYMHLVVKQKLLYCGQEAMSS